MAALPPTEHPSSEFAGFSLSNLRNPWLFRLFGNSQKKSQPSPQVECHLPGERDNSGGNDPKMRSMDLHKFTTHFPVSSESLRGYLGMPKPCFLDASD